GGQLEIAGHLVAEQQRNLAQQAAEARSRGFLVAHDGELVLHEGVIDDGNALHPVGLTVMLHGSIDVRPGRGYLSLAVSHSNLLAPAGVRPKGGTVPPMAPRRRIGYGPPRSHQCRKPMMNAQTNPTADELETSFGFRKVDPGEKQPLVNEV